MLIYFEEIDAPVAVVTGLAEIPGTPLPEHIAELLSRGGVVEPSDLSKLGVTMTRTTKEALEDLYSAGRLITVDTSRYANAEVG